MPAAGLRDATPDDLPALRALFARANDAPYALDVVAEEKCFGDGIAGAPRTRVIERDGRLAGAAVTCGKWLRLLIVDRDLRRQGIGTALLADSGAKVIAAEAGNYFTPGVLASDEGALAFFEARGYRRGKETWNLEVRGPRAEVRIKKSHHSSFGPRTSDLNPAVASFIEHHFGSIWRFESSRARAIFITEDASGITGFAAIEANNRGLGTFGPTGVAKSHRGKGLGRELVLAALAAHHRNGDERAVIPWTDALDYYRKACGAEPAHRFIGLEIDSAP